jgi:hypothetical protein
MYQRAEAGGQWLPPAELVRTSKPYGYTQYGNSLCVDRQNRLHLVFHIYDGHPDGRGHTAGYLRSSDGGATWTKAGGEGVLIPADHRSVDVLRTGPELDMRVSNVICDPDDRPYLVVPGTPRPGDAELLWHDGQQWQGTALLDAVRQVRPGCFMANDTTLSFDRDGCLYIGVQTVPEPAIWGGADAELALLFSTDRGKSFQAQRVSPAGDSVPCWQPCFERVSSFYQEAPETPTMTYTRGTVGTGCSSRDYTEVHFVILAKG